MVLLRKDHALLVICTHFLLILLFICRPTNPILSQFSPVNQVKVKGLFVEALII